MTNASPEQKAKRRAHYVANKEKHRQTARRRDHARHAREGKPRKAFTPEQVLAQHGSDCHLCGEPIDMAAPRQIGKPGWERGFHQDHVVPLSKGGAHSIENTMPAHGLCNISKGAVA